MLSSFKDSSFIAKSISSLFQFNFKTPFIMFWLVLDGPLKCFPDFCCVFFLLATSSMLHPKDGSKLLLQTMQWCGAVSQRPGVKCRIFEQRPAEFPWSDHVPVQVIILWPAFSSLWCQLATLAFTTRSRCLLITDLAGLPSLVTNGQKGAVNQANSDGKGEYWWKWVSLSWN